MSHFNLKDSAASSEKTSESKPSGAMTRRVSKGSQVKTELGREGSQATEIKKEDKPPSLHLKEHSQPRSRSPFEIHADQNRSDDALGV